MADIASLIANSAQTNADFNFGKINDAYYKGQDEAQKNALRNAFSGGIPIGPDGQPDYGEMSKKLFQLGDVSNANALANLDLLRQKMRYGQQSSEQDFPVSGGGQTTSPPSLNRSASVSTAPDLTKQQPQSTLGSNAQPTVRSILATQGINDPQGETATSLARQLGVNPNDPLDVNDPRISGIIRPAIAQYKRMGVGQVYTEGQATPQPQVVLPVAQAGQQPQPQPVVQPQPQVAQQQPQPQVAQGNDPTLGGLVPSRYTPQQYLDLLSRRMGSGMLDPEQMKAYQARASAIQTAMQPTDEQKKAAASGMSLPKYQERQGELAAEQAGASERAKTDVKEQNDLITAGRTAQNRLTTLNTMSNIINSDNNMTLGAGGDTALKIKMALKQLNIPVGDLSGALAYQKLGTTLAGEQTKALGGSRPTQFEFKTFLGVNPGLLLDREGNLRMLGIFSQLAKREVDLGRLARQNRDNWDNWDNVVKKYDFDNPMRDPKTGQPITTDTIIAPGKGGDVFEKARAAIAQGASKDAVIKRLKDAGHDPAGL